MTEAYIITLFDRNGASAFTTVVERSTSIRDEIARCAKVLDERFQSATVHHWQRVHTPRSRWPEWRQLETFDWQG